MTNEERWLIYQVAALPQSTRDMFRTSELMILEARLFSSWPTLEQQLLEIRWLVQQAVNSI